MNKKASHILLVVVMLSMVLMSVQCVAPAPQVVEKVVTQVVEKEVQVVQTQVVEKEVKVVETQVVEKVVEKAAEPAPEPVYDFDPTVTAAKPYKIAVVLKNFTNPFWLTHQKAAEKAGQDLGVEVTVLAPSKPDNVEEQIRIVEDLIQKKVDGVVIAPANTQAIATAVQKLNEAGIPVVYDNTRGSGGDYVAYVGADNILVGQTMGKTMCEKLGGTGKVLVLEGMPGQQTADDRRKGANEALAACPDLQIVSQTAHWTRVEGLQVTENVLQRFPDLNGIIGIGGEMALGAIEALKTAGVPDGQVLVQGMDVYPDIQTAINNGTMAYTISQAPGNQAYFSVALLVKYLNGESVPNEIRTPVVVVNPDNLTEYAEE